MAYAIYDEADDTWAVFCDNDDCEGVIQAGYGDAEDAEDDAAAHNDDHDLADFYG